MNIKDQLLKINFKKQIKIRTQVNKDNTSLYLDLIKNKKRQTKFLKIYLTGKKKEDKEKLKLAINIREKLELELLTNEYNFQLNRAIDHGDFIAFFQEVAKDKKSNPYKSTLNKLLEFRKHIPLNTDTEFWEDFYSFLLTKVSMNTAGLYLTKVRAVYNVAIRKKLVVLNPTRTIVIKKEETKKEFLAIEDLKHLMATPCDHVTIRNAFIFSCFTGLRVSDIRNN